MKKDTKTIKANGQYNISWKLIFNISDNTWYIEILDDWKWTEKSVWFEKFDDLNNAVDELKHRIKRNENYKLGFSIMNYFYKKWYDLWKAWRKVDEINNDFSNIDEMMKARIEYVKNNNIKIVNSLYN